MRSRWGSQIRAHFHDQLPALYLKHFALNTLFYGTFVENPSRVFSSTPPLHLLCSVDSHGFTSPLRLFCDLLPPKLKSRRARVLDEASAPQQLHSSTRNPILLKIVRQHGGNRRREGLLERQRWRFRRRRRRWLRQVSSHWYSALLICSQIYFTRCTLP